MQNNRFVKSVIEMRKAQETFFSTHSRTDLYKAKQIEKSVDALLLQITRRQREEQRRLNLWKGE